jgi:hypothetical protein
MSQFNILKELTYIGSNYLDSGAGHVVLFTGKTYVIFGVTTEPRRIGDQPYSPVIQHYKTIIVLGDNGKIYQVPYDANDWKVVKSEILEKVPTTKEIIAQTTPPVKRQRIFNIPKPKDKS